MTTPSEGKTIEQLLEEQNALIRKQNKLFGEANATANGMSFRDDMRDTARRWDAANPVAKFFFKNPYGQWK